MKPQTIRFLKNGEAITLHAVPPTRTLLEVLREDLHCTGTKEGCGEGDCGACTVVIGQERDGKLHTSAINSCIRLAHSVDGLAVWTAEGLTQDNGAPHPVQEALKTSHASQCGFCTPGFAMSLFGLYQKHAGQSIDRTTAQNALSGNLCRCTGYRPIVQAAQAMQQLPAVALDHPKILEALSAMADTPSKQDAYLSPRNLKSLLQLRKQWPDAQLVAGCTDVGLWVTKQHREFAKVIDITRVKELRDIQEYPHHLAIGAAVTLTNAFAALVADRPQLQSFAHRFAGLPVRNSGTLGGNVANGSPIGDSMPLLIALGAQVILMSTRGHRRMPLENLYTGYRKNVMQADEVLAWIVVPKANNATPVQHTKCQWCEVYKISKRFEDDISAVCLALDIHIDKAVVTHASIGVGGVAATPVRARATEKALLGKPWNPQTLQDAMECLRNEFSPISDMRASSSYRREVLGNLLWRFWLESQGQADVDLQALEPLDLKWDLAGAAV
jgi:xanthine dehydrogenase small subunit